MRGYWASAEAATQLEDMLAGSAELARALQGDHCFVHGDCYVANLLRDRDRLIWIDWQGCGWAHPAEDFALLWLRAGWDHATPPHASMLEAHQRTRRSSVDNLERSVTAAELGLLLFAVPHFAGLRSTTDRDWATGRLLHLWHTWSGGRAD